MDFKFGGIIPSKSEKQALIKFLRNKADISLG